jgi:hypothetical protein
MEQYKKDETQYLVVRCKSCSLAADFMWLYRVVSFFRWVWGIVYALGTVDHVLKIC